ncbi:hypothetical protein B0H19DRAFT_1381700, partial [Mycena capillaripes]
MPPEPCPSLSAPTDDTRSKKNPNTMRPAPPVSAPHRKRRMKLKRLRMRRRSRLFFNSSPTSTILSAPFGRRRSPLLTMKGSTIPTKASIPSCTVTLLPRSPSQTTRTTLAALPTMRTPIQSACHAVSASVGRSIRRC